MATNSVTRKRRKVFTIYRASAGFAPRDWPKLCGARDMVPRLKVPAPRTTVKAYPGRVIDELAAARGRLGVGNVIGLAFGLCGQTTETGPAGRNGWLKVACDIGATTRTIRIMAVVASVQNLSKIYRKPGTNVEVAALRSINLEFIEGEYTAIMGASGSGKSTLMNIIGCLDQPDAAGSYVLGGDDISQLDGRRAVARSAAGGSGSSSRTST